MSKQKDEELQKKYLELQIIVQQINNLQQQFSNIQNQIFELNTLKDSLNSIKDIKENSESFVPIGFNIFAKTKLHDTNELLVNVGSNVFVIKTVEETNSLIDSQIRQVELIIKEIEDKLYELEKTGELLQSQIIGLSNK